MSLVSAEPHATPRRTFLVLAAGFATATAVGAWVSWGLGWPREQAFMTAILLAAAAFWITEVIPLFATSVLIVIAEILLLANPGGWSALGFAAGEGPSFTAVLNAAVDSTLVLFFAGLVLARAAVKERVDQTMAAWMLRPFIHSPRILLVGVMGVTALFSMWMSNTATAAFMLTLTVPFLAQVGPTDPFRKALLLAVPFAANIGGLGTPIASPPNAIAIGYLLRAGIRVDFLDWMLIALPLMALMLALSVWILLRRFPPQASLLTFSLPAATLSRRGRGVVGLFTLTVLLWMTEGLHGLPAATVALLPVAGLLLLGVIDRRDINGIDWDVLLLIAGGLALGFGLDRTGLDERLTPLLPSGSGALVLFAVLVLLTLVLGTFLSNTAVANLLLPIGLAAAVASGTSEKTVGMGIALMSSLCMSLPISTPPNAMAYARGGISLADMARVGTPISIAGALIIIAGGLLLA